MGREGLIMIVYWIDVVINKWSVYIVNEYSIHVERVQNIVGLKGADVSVNCFAVFADTSRNLCYWFPFSSLGLEGLTH